MLGETIYRELDEAYLTPQDNSNFMQFAFNIAEQVRTWEIELFGSMLTLNLMIEQMLEPALFNDSIENFPLKWNQVNPRTF